MTRIEISIRARFHRIPAAWNMRVLAEGKRRPETFLFPVVDDDGSIDGFKVRDLDIWKCRDAFFAIPEGNNDALIRFLNKTGVWSNMELSGHWSEEVIQHHHAGNPVPVSAEGIWGFRKALKRALTEPETFKTAYAAPSAPPRTGGAWAARRAITFDLQMELSNVASGLVVLSETYNALVASVVFDLARGIRFGSCARCIEPFPFGRQPKKMFCSPRCAHAACESRNRPKRKKALERRIVAG